MSATARCLCLVTLSLLVCGRASAQDDKPHTQASPKFIRLNRDRDNTPIALQTATVRYRPSAGDDRVVVDLIGVVHMGDRDYYRKLERQFKDYDVLLYELVAPRGTRVPRGGRSDNPLALILKLATAYLGLEMQTEAIDYSADNFVHADMSPDEMAEVMRKRGDDGLTIALGVAADMLRQMNVQQQKDAARQGKDKDREPEIEDILELLASPEGPGKIKRALAEQLASLDDPGAGIGQTLSRILVADRNQAALRVLDKEIARGRKKIGIFYGAAHMPDFDVRLRADFGLRPVSSQWHTAWDLRRPGAGIEGLLFRLLMDR